MGTPVSTTQYYTAVTSPLNDEGKKDDGTKRFDGWFDKMNMKVSFQPPPTANNDNKILPKTEARIDPKTISEIMQKQLELISDQRKDFFDYLRDKHVLDIHLLTDDKLTEYANDFLVERIDFLLPGRDGQTEQASQETASNVGQKPSSPSSTQIAFGDTNGSNLQNVTSNLNDVSVTDTSKSENQQSSTNTSPQSIPRSDSPSSQNSDTESPNLYPSNQDKRLFNQQLTLKRNPESHSSQKDNCPDLQRTQPVEKLL